MNVVWRRAIEASADPARVRHLLTELKAAGRNAFLTKATAEQVRILVALLSGSQAAGDSLLAHPEWLDTALEASALEHPRQKQGLQREAAKWFEPLLEQKDFNSALAKLREFNQRERTRIAARDLARLGDVTQITGELSDLADVCLEGVYRICTHRLVDRFGTPYHADPDERWQRTSFCVLGLGKLGGRELNYSSDVDVIFIYSEEGFAFKGTPQARKLTGKGLSNHQFFTRLAEAFIAEVSSLTSEGTLYRIDLRLRPEGQAGPLVRSLSSYETYYAQWGQTWERMMLIKARAVAGDPALGAEFIESIQAFRYPRGIAETILDEISAIKDRIEKEVVKAGELERNVKLGRGGIREIEFTVQTLQLLHGGRIPFLQGGQTLPGLQKLVDYHLLPAADATVLSQAYVFLRDVEHRLQMDENQQVHTIPTERKARERLAALMNCSSVSEFERSHRSHTQRVREVYETLLKRKKAPDDRMLPREFEGNEDVWTALLAQHGFRDPAKAFHLLQLFVQGPGYFHVSARTLDLALQLISQLLQLCPHPSRSFDPNSRQPVLSDPDRVLARLDSFVSAYGSRSMLYELWSSNLSLFVLLLLLFDRSEFLAETAIRTPDLVDELQLSGRLGRRKTALEILADLRHGLSDQDQRLWIRRYHQAEFMRIGLREILGLADFELNLAELSGLADACLQYALEVVLRKHKIPQPPLVIIGLGKLGGAELNYGSDLDLMFVADPAIENLPDLQRLAVEIMDLLSSPTELGIAFLTDARLRPDGQKGLLVNTLSAYEDYYRNRALLWEVQALTRIRPIAGDLKLGQRFQKMAAPITDFRQRPERVAAYQTGWKAEIARMRQRIEKERTPAGKDDLAIKTGSGGLMDAEFVAQVFALENGWQEPNTLRALEKARDSGGVPREDVTDLITNFRQLRRVECILRRWSFVGETLLPDDPAPLYRVAVRCGYPAIEPFMAAVKGYRAVIRRVYSKIMPPPKAA